MGVRSTMAVLAMAAFLASCGAAVDLRLKADGSAGLDVQAEVPEALDAKLRSFVADSGVADSGLATKGPLFSAKAIEAEARSRGLSVRESAAPTPRSYRGSFAAPKLAEVLAGDPSLAKAVAYASGPGWGSLSVRVDRSNARAVAALFPGIDPDLLEALQPPALYDNPVTEAEYRSMLAALLGKTAVSALDGLTLRLAISAPGAILESGGLSAAPGGASLSIGALKAMVLEKPIEFSLKWRQ